jgi:hypothetical protein
MSSAATSGKRKAVGRAAVPGACAPFSRERWRSAGVFIDTRAEAGAMTGASFA